MNAIEMKIEIDDTYMNVIKFGSGKKCLVIIAGVSLCGIEGLGPMVEAEYREFEEDFTIYVVERKKELPDGYSIQQMSEDVCMVLDEIDVKEMYLYGVSQGGMIAQCIAMNHPEMVDKMVICSSQCRITETAKSVIGKWIELAEKKNVVDINRSFFEKVYSKAYLEKYKDILPVIEKKGTEEDCARFKVLVSACMEFDIYDDMDKIKCPTYVIGDKNDNVLGVEGSYEIIDRLKCRSQIYEEYSHAVYDEAKDITERIFNFFEE